MDGSRGGGRTREGRRPGRKAEATIFLEAQIVSILQVEDFIDSLEFLLPAEHDRLKIAAGEIFDNLVRHASPLEDGRLALRATKRASGIVLGFYFRSETFASFASSCADFEPLFDPAHRRWRGMGLLMCRNLSSVLRFRPGTRLDRILLSFDSEIRPAIRPVEQKIPALRK
jgi:anti-sigma regulatory factor (Ser/Thr protein kinase)